MEALRAAFTESFPGTPFPEQLPHILFVHLYPLTKEEEALMKAVQGLLSFWYRMSGDHSVIMHWVMRSAGRDVPDLGDHLAREELRCRLGTTTTTEWLPYDLATRIICDGLMRAHRTSLAWFRQRLRSRYPRVLDNNSLLLDADDREVREWLWRVPQTGGDHDLLPDEASRQHFYAIFGTHIVPPAVADSVRRGDGSALQLQPPVHANMARFLLH